MKYRVVDTNGRFFPTYFKTKKEAAEYAAKDSRFAIERKICGNWRP